MVNAQMRAVILAILGLGATAARRNDGGSVAVLSESTNSEVEISSGYFNATVVSEKRVVKGEELQSILVLRTNLKPALAPQHANSARSLRPGQTLAVFTSSSEDLIRDQIIAEREHRKVGLRNAYASLTAAQTFAAALSSVAICAFGVALLYFCTRRKEKATESVVPGDRVDEQLARAAPSDDAVSVGTHQLPSVPEHTTPGARRPAQTDRFHPSRRAPPAESKNIWTLLRGDARALVSSRAAVRVLDVFSLKKRIPSRTLIRVDAWIQRALKKIDRRNHLNARIGDVLWYREKTTPELLKASRPATFVRNVSPRDLLGGATRRLHPRAARGRHCLLCCCFGKGTRVASIGSGEFYSRSLSDGDDEQPIPVM